MEQADWMLERTHGVLF